MFHVGVSYQEFFRGFFRFHLGSLRFCFGCRVQTGGNKAKELGFHLGIL